MTASTVTQPTDAELVLGWQQGDEAAASLLVARHAAAVGRFLASRGAPEAELDDLVQEVLIRAFRHAESWRGEGAFRGWLYRIAANLLTDRHRRNAGRIYLEVADHDRVETANPETEMVADETASALQRGLASLARLQREVFLLRVEQGLDYAEIATALDTTVGAARVHYHHAVKRLKEMLG